MKKITGLKIKQFVVVFMCMLALVFIGVTVNHRILEKWQPDQSVIGTWIGSGETRKFGELEKINVVITIDESGAVTGMVGEALLEECVVKLNRNDFERFINVKNDYIIKDGHISGAIKAEDDTVYRDISMPFDIKEDSIGGTLFHVEGMTYPDPLLLHLELEKSKE